MARTQSYIAIFAQNSKTLFWKQQATAVGAGGWRSRSQIFLVNCDYLYFCHAFWTISLQHRSATPQNLLVEHLTGEFMREYANFIHSLSTRTASSRPFPKRSKRSVNIICPVLSFKKAGKKRIVMVWLRSWTCVCQVSFQETFRTCVFIFI